MCFVLGRIFGTVAIAFAPSLPSKTLHLIVRMSIVSGDNSFFTSNIKPISHRTSLVASDSAEYLLSVVDSTISVCIFDARTIGQPAIITMYAVVESSVAVSISQPP